jgi:carboxyl-terminal processing protease
METEQKNKGRTVTACVITGVCTFVITAMLTAGAGLTLLQGTNFFRGTAAPNATVQPGATAGATAQAGDYSRLDEIREVYHDKALSDVTDAQLIDGAAKGMALVSGDVYSEFFTKDEFGEFQQAEAGNYVGIGVSVNVDPKDSLITAIVVYKGSPAEKGGMRPGDKILKVDDTDVTLLGLDQTVKLVRGEAGTQVRLTVLRGEDQIELTMTREKVTVEFASGNMIAGTGGLGYIKITEFNGNAATLFHQLVTNLKSQGMKGFILDLRNNPGGGLDVVAPIADELFPSGPIITMEDKDGNVLDKIDSGASYLNIPMVVLVNENSASASELLSGGIQDYKVGTLVGVTTYGKGVGQQFAMLSDGSVLKYTAFKYLTGGGRCPQSIGVKPDIEVELAQAVKDNPLLLCTAQDNQYQRAIEELQKLITSK